MLKMYLPFGTDPLYLCPVCGYCGPVLIETCEKNDQIALEKPALNLLDEVEYFRPPHSIDTTSDLRKERATIQEIWYSKPGTELGRCDWTRLVSPKPHTLCITLATSWNGISNDRPWKPGDSSMGLVSMTYSDFLLYQEGDLKKLQKAGLMEKPKGTPFFLSEIKDLLFGKR